MHNKTEYIGIGVKKLTTGEIFAVIVKEKNSNNFYDLDLEDYLSREIQPPIESLPDKTS